MGTMNGGNYGEDGSHREQQLVFRWDNHPLGQAPHLMVELREAGYIEICGGDHEGIHSQLSNWLSENWGCKETKSSTQQPFCDKKLTWKYKDMTIASAELTAFFHHIGWSMMICSQGTVKIKSDPNSREQQILFRPGASGHGEIEPHLFIELYTGEGKQDLYMCPNKTQVLAKQYVRIKEVGDCTHAREKFCEFMTEYLGGSPMEENDCTGFHVDCFLARGLTDNNLGYLTMRICDFMVDALGWSFVVCNVCNLGDGGLFREQQMVFRWDGERREIPPVRDNNGVIDWVKFPGLKFPSYWQSKKVLSLRKAVETVSCQPEEIEALQEIFDKTFKRVLTRDRVYEYQLGVSAEMPFRLEAVHAFRSEHAELYRRFMERRASYSGGEQYRPKTLEGGAFLNKRLMPGEALHAHGTNPSSAMGILKTGFSLSASLSQTSTLETTMEAHTPGSWQCSCVVPSSGNLTSSLKLETPLMKQRQLVATVSAATGNRRSERTRSTFFSMRDPWCQSMLSFISASTTEMPFQLKCARTQRVSRAETGKCGSRGVGRIFRLTCPTSSTSWRSRVV